MLTAEAGWRHSSELGGWLETGYPHVGQNPERRHRKLLEMVLKAVNPSFSHSRPFPPRPGSSTQGQPPVFWPFPLQVVE